MKQTFSKLWLGSKQPRKQRKYLYNVKHHLKRKLMASGLSKDLKKKYGINAIEVRKEDVVKVMRGKFKKKQGKVTGIDMAKMKISVEGIQTTKRDGTKVNVLIHPSKVQIIELKNDEKRFKRNKTKNAEVKKEMKSEKEIKTKKKMGEKNAQEKK